MAWSGPATRKQTDKQRDQAAKVAQRWLQRGFTPEAVAEGIQNKIGYQTDVKDGIVRFWGFYNDEAFRDTRVIREITAEKIISYQ